MRLKSSTSDLHWDLEDINTRAKAKHNSLGYTAVPEVILPSIGSWVPIPWVHWRFSSFLMSLLLENQPHDFNKEWPVLGFFIPKAQPSHLNRGPHKVNMCFMDVSFQELARRGCSPPASPWSSCLWSSHIFRQFFRMRRPCFCFSIRLCIWVSVFWLALFMMVHGSQGGDMWMYRGFVRLMNSNALLHPDLVERSYPLWTPNRTARPPASMTAWANGESQGAHNSTRSNRLVILRNSSTTKASWSRALRWNHSWWPLDNALSSSQLRSHSEDSDGSAGTVHGTEAWKTAELHSGFKICASAEPLKSRSRDETWWSCP